MSDVMSSQWVQDTNSQIDLLMDQVDGIEKKQKTQQLMIMGVAAAVIAEGFMIFTVVKGIKNITDGMSQLGQATKALMEYTGIMNQQTQPSPMKAEQGANVGRPMKVEPRVAPEGTATPAEGPTSEAPEWVKQRNEEDLVEGLAADPFGED